MTLAEQVRAIKHALSVVDLARLLQLDDETIRRHVRKNRIPYFKVGMAIRFDPDQLADWLEDKSPIDLSPLNRTALSMIS
jgi:excisionase family DNA binding protein